MGPSNSHAVNPTRLSLCNKVSTMLPRLHFLHLSSPRKALLQQVKQNEQKQTTGGNVLTTFYDHLNSLLFSNLFLLFLLPLLKLYTVLKPNILAKK